MDESRYTVMSELYRSNNSVFIGEITWETVQVAIAEMAQLALQSPSHIDMVISSPGGMTDAGLYLCDFMDYGIDIPIHCKTWGMCNSSATFVLLCCKKRIATRRTKFVIHRQTTGLEIEYDEQFQNKVDAWKEEQASLLQTLIEFYCEKLQMSKREVKSLLERGSRGINHALSAKEALEIGLITEIL